jgi:hypothetical protein
VALQGDGKIVITGAERIPSYVSVDRAFVERFTTDGTVAVSYGPAGTGIAEAVIGVSSSPQAMVIQPDGKALIAGYVSLDGTSDVVFVVRFLATGPQVGSFAAAPNPVASGASETLTASGITDGNAGATVTKVEFYYFDPSGNKVTLGTGTQTGPGAWALAFTMSLPPGTYTLYARATDNYGAVGDPISLSLQVV